MAEICSVCLKMLDNLTEIPDYEEPELCSECSEKVAELCDNDCDRIDKFMGRLTKNKATYERACMKILTA